MAGTVKIYYLEQQSPMLHFQHADPNATLRVTELKPKLDRFIGEWLGRRSKGLPPEWRMKKEREEQAGEKEDEKKDAALDYRVRILNVKGNTTYEPSRDMPYFGNMGKDTEKKMCVMAKGRIELQIRCYIRELLDVIDECLPTFLLTANFGTRQDKGFGGFVLCGDDGRPLQKRAENEELLAQWYGGNTVYCIRYKTQVSDNEKLSDINTIYKILKSGINDPPAKNGKKRAYIKPYLWDYFNAKGIDWEKKVLKYDGTAPAVYNPDYAPTPPGPNKRYIRGLLGIGDQQEWFSSDGSGGRIIKGINHKGDPVYEKETITVESDDKVIERIPSPLTFKIIGNAVYILPGEIDSRVPGSWFAFKNKSGGGHTRLQIPSAGEFDLGEIMNGFKDKVNSVDVKKEFGKRPEGKRPAFIRQGCMMEVL